MIYLVKRYSQQMAYCSHVRIEMASFLATRFTRNTRKFRFISQLSVQSSVSSYIETRLSDLFKLYSITYLVLPIGNLMSA